MDVRKDNSEARRDRKERIGRKSFKDQKFDEIERRRQGERDSIDKNKIARPRE